MDYLYWNHQGYLLKIHIPMVNTIESDSMESYSLEVSPRSLHLKQYDFYAHEI